ncbi:DUF2977 domain-containing protein [Staphylococcus shinii]|uniref:DUF2977 domain-containing protein n=1 Tax=Staphylococcus shinii TaxID=2912228 RepID=UPI003519BF29
MKILVNNKNEILSYTLVENQKTGIDVSTEHIPVDFFTTFQVRKYKFENGVVVFNEDYDNIDIDNAIPYSIDQDVRVAFGGLQMSSVQTVKMVMDLSKQVALLTKQNVELQNQLNDKGVE